MDKKFLKQLVLWHENNEFQKIVDAIIAIPEQERDYHLVSQLARALNNLDDYETAVEMLLSVEQEGQDDPLWYFRLGYAYYYSRRFQEAKEKFERVLEMSSDDEDAEMFLNWCNQELSSVGSEEKLNNRLIPAETIMSGKTFQERVDEFWEWFTQNESKLAEMVERREQEDAEKMVEFISEGVRLISDEVNFNVGGDYEFTFAVEGNNYLFYLLPWLVKRMPEQFREKWHFFPYMQSTAGEDFGFQMYGKDVQLSHVMVKMEYEQERDYFNLRFYEEQLCTLEENQCYNAFSIMMELAIGEGMSRIYINKTDRAEAVEAGMFPLTKLESCMAVVLEEAGKNILTRPDERYSVYRMNFEENKDLRYDMVIGTTCFPELTGDYFNGEVVNVDKLATCGAKAVFLVVPFGDADSSDMLNLRYEIEDRLVADILGERGSGEEIGILLGGAMGKECFYIDLLLYNAPLFMFRGNDLLKNYSLPFYLAEFRPESKLIAMTGVSVKSPEVLTEPSELAKEMMVYMDCPCEWFAPMADAEPLDKAYFEALETGKAEGFIPVLVSVNETLMECMAMNVDEESGDDFQLENVRAYRHRMLEEVKLPDPSVYFKELQKERKEEWEEEEQWSEIIGEMEEGHADHDLLGYWNYETRLTEEMLLVKIPVDQPWKIFAWLPMGNWNACPDIVQLLAVAKYWYELYGAIPALVTNDVVEFYVSKPVEGADIAMKLAMEHYLFCPDCVEQCGEDDTVGKRASSLLQSTVWYFWWD